MKTRNVNVGIYCSLVVAGFVTAMAASSLFFYVTVSASQHLHDSMFARVLRAPIHFFDTNPVGEFRKLSVFSLCNYRHSLRTLQREALTTITNQSHKRLNNHKYGSQNHNHDQNLWLTARLKPPP